MNGKSKLPCQVSNFYCYFFIGRQLLTSRTTVFFLLVCVLRDGIAKRFQRSLSQVPPHRWDVRVTNYILAISLLLYSLVP